MKRKIMHRTGFGSYITHLRTINKLTQNDLAIATGYSPAMIALMEQGHRTPAVDGIMRISKFFNVPADEVFRQAIAS